MEKTDSELIAEFMGYTMTSITDLSNYYINDWNKLMPVIEKIHLSKTYKPHWSRDKFVGVDIEIRPLYCKIELPDTSEDYDYVMGEWNADPLFCMLNANYGTTIECVYNSVVAYIKWYNSLNTKTTLKDNLKLWKQIN